MVIEFPEFNITLHEVLGGNARDLADLLAIHQALFPQYTYYHAYMRERAQNPPDAEGDSIDHWWLVRLKGEAIAINLFTYLPRRGCGVVLAIAVKPDFRAIAVGRYQRMAEFLLMKSIEQVQVDAKACDQPVPLGVVAEVEDYLVKRYQQYNFVRLPVDYAEPSFMSTAQTSLASDGQELTFHPLNLCFYPVRPNVDLAEPAILKDILYALLVDYYELPETHWFVDRTIASIASSE